MKVLFTSFLITFSISLLAQPQIRSVTLTDRNNKVQSGFIRYYDWDEQPAFIDFTTDSLGPMQSMALRNIQKLAIRDGPFYESLYLSVPYYARDPLKQGESIVERVDSTYYLSELLLDSHAVKLYSFMDANKAVRFVIAKYDSLVMLDNIHVKLFRGGLIYNFDEPAFRKTLKAVLYECPTLNTTQITYTEKSLIDVLKDYLSFCRIDSKILLEQKKISKPIVGAGVFGAFGRRDGESVVSYGINVQVLLPRQFHNLFALLNVGAATRVISTDGGISNLFFVLYGDRYFGRRALQGKIYTGISTLGLLDTGVGISYRKLISADIRYALLSSVLGELYSSDFKSRPFFTISAILPISRSRTN